MGRPPQVGRSEKNSNKEGIKGLCNYKKAFNAPRQKVNKRKHVAVQFLFRQPEDGLNCFGRTWSCTTSQISSAAPSPRQGGRKEEAGLSTHFSKSATCTSWKCEESPQDYRTLGCRDHWVRLLWMNLPKNSLNIQSAPYLSLTGEFW